MAAIKAAHESGLDTVEIDVAQTAIGQDDLPEVYLGHYFSMAAVAGAQTESPQWYSLQQLEQFRMNKRPPVPSFSADDALTSFRAAIGYAHQNNMILMADPKIADGASDDSYGQIIAQMLLEARASDALQNLVVKSDRSLTITLNSTKLALKTSPYSWAQFEGQFLWSAVVNKDVTVSLLATLDAIDAWYSGTDNSLGVLTFEVSLYAPDNNLAKPFNRKNRHYQNVLDYIRQLTPLGKRFAMWSVDPMSDKGTLGRSYNWKFIGNSPDDQRGNPLVNLSYEFSHYALITTDRPDVYRAIVGP